MPDNNLTGGESAPTPFELVTSRIAEQDSPAANPPAPPGFDWVTDEELARRLGFRICGDRRQIAEDAAHMASLRQRGFENWERG